MKSTIGKNSGVKFVQRDILCEGPFSKTNCIACASTNLRLCKTLGPIVDFLNPVRNEPYPTYAAEWAESIDVNCLDCGVHYGNFVFLEGRVPVDELPTDVLTRKRLDLSFDDEYDALLESFEEFV